MYSKINTYIPRGMTALSSIVEASVLPGLPSFSISGMSRSRTREIESRLRAAINHSGLTWPRGRIITAIAPAWLEKSGSLYDLPLALAILKASGQITDLPLAERLSVLGELGLNAAIRGIPQIYSCLELAAQNPDHSLLLPRDNLKEAALFPELSYAPVNDLSEVLDYFQGLRKIDRVKRKLPTIHPETGAVDPEILLNFRAFRGQVAARRALLISLAGWHPLMLLGAPGTGKTMLLHLARGLLPPLASTEISSLKKIHSLSDHYDKAVLEDGQRPFLDPHYSVSKAALVGGGKPIKPGLFSLAHAGILCLDELTEYTNGKTELLREALSSGKILLARAQEKIVLPCNFLFLSAANPCPCGYCLEGRESCRCSDRMIKKYLARISGAIWDRFHLLGLTYRENFTELEDQTEADFYTTREQIRCAWQRQAARSGLSDHYLNGQNPHFQADAVTGFSPAMKQKIYTWANDWQLSYRQLNQTLRVSRTIADLANHDAVRLEDVEEALYFRVDPFREISFRSE